MSSFPALDSSFFTWSSMLVLNHTTVNQMLVLKKNDWKSEEHWVSMPTPVHRLQTVRLFSLGRWPRWQVQLGFLGDPTDLNNLHHWSTSFKFKAWSFHRTKLSWLSTSPHFSPVPAAQWRLPKWASKIGSEVPNLQANYQHIFWRTIRLVVVHDMKTKDK